MEEAKAESILMKIAKHRTEVIEGEKQKLPALQLAYKSLANPPRKPIDLLKRILDRKFTNGKVAVWAEIKRASPSKGLINGEVNPAAQADKYARGGCVAISVLTEPKWFKGTIDDLRAVSQTLIDKYDDDETRPAVLLKDFVVDEWQLLQARASGADTALLIVALLPLPRLGELIGVARAMGMEPLVEVATVLEMQTALTAGAKLIGINNRNLHTFTVDNNNTITIINTVPEQDRDGIAIIALSGIKTREDVVAFENAGAKGVLVGEALMRSDDPVGMVQALMGADV